MIHFQEMNEHRIANKFHVLYKKKETKQKNALRTLCVCRHSLRKTGEEIN